MTDVFAIAPTAESVAALSEELRRIEACGAKGVLTGDHLFLTPGSRRHSDPLTYLAALGALSDSLLIGTYVANVWLRHPAQLLRELAQLAALYGGDRVVAGLGAGWHAAEFAALGAPIPTHGQRLRRLEDVVRIAHAAFAGDAVTVDGESFSLVEFRLSPLPRRRPTLLVGGGSAAVCAVAARYADILDLNAPARSTGPPGATPAGDLHRRLATTVADLEAAARTARSAAAEAGRERSLRVSTFIHAVHLCRRSEASGLEAELCGEGGLSPRPLADCPFVLVGDAAQIRTQLEERVERIGLDMIVVAAAPGALQIVADGLC
jgi:alkanesulfonate monooxygenase SsuD/methylene tetrahydromethanopterin reductase-like flavin-dependent oxidoreductase (luciferase family)